MDSDDLSPADGLCNIFLEFDGLDRHQGSSHANFRFRFVHKEQEQEFTMAVLSLPVSAADDGMEGMMVRAHDQLIRVLRQSLYVSDKMRQHYRSEAARYSPKAT